MGGFADSLDIDILIPAGLRLLSHLEKENQVLQLAIYRPRWFPINCGNDQVSLSRLAEAGSDMQGGPFALLSPLHKRDFHRVQLLIHMPEIFLLLHAICWISLTWVCLIYLEQKDALLCQGPSESQPTTIYLQVIFAERMQGALQMPYMI